MDAPVDDLDSAFKNLNMLLAQTQNETKVDLAPRPYM
jgi:hypothetical protein